MAAGPVFPGFIKIEYKTDGSSKAKFLAEAAQLGGEIKKPFSVAFDQIGKMVDLVSGKLKDGDFRLDLDVSSLRQASAQADFTMKKVQALRDAAISLATSNRDSSESTQAFVKALQAQAAQAEAAASSARDQVTAYSNLQTAVQGLTRENEALAQSYRDTFLEQAKVANAAYKAQQQFNALSAPGIGRSAKSARDSASVFESQSYAPKADLRSGLDRLLDGQASIDRAALSGARLEDVLGRVANRGKEVSAALREAAAAAQKAADEQAKVVVTPRPANALPQNTRAGADALVAGQASIDRAAVSATTLEQVLGRVANKGREVGAALAEAERSAAAAVKERLDAEAQAAAAAEKIKGEAAAEMQRLAQAAGLLRAELDPAIAAQNRFNTALDRADELLKAGAIDQRTYAQAVSKAQGDLQQSWAALTASEQEQQRVAKKGTDAHQSVINSMRSVRVAGIQAGQQLQDMAVQFQMGTNASTILAQQLPQLGFALSGLEGNTNKTADKLGKLGTFLSGPWGAAILIAGVAIAPLIEEMLKLNDAVDDALGKMKENADATEVTRKAKEAFKTTLQGVREAIIAQKTALDLQADSLRTEAERTRDAAKANLEHEIQIRRTTEALLTLAKAQAAAANSTTFGAGGAAGAAGAQRIFSERVSALEEQLKEANRLTKIAESNLNNAKSFVDVESGQRAADPLKQIDDRYKDLIEKARRRAVAEGTIGDALARQVTALERQRDAAKEAIQVSRRTGSGMSGREITSSEATSIARSAGFQVNSADRSYAKQKALYDQWVAAGRPADNPVAKPGTSAHERGNALDIQFGQGVTPASIRKAFSDEGVRLTKVFKERGHFHVEWSTSGADKVQREAEQLEKLGNTAAESIARINDRFNEQPRLIDQAVAATRELNATIATLNDQRPTGYKEMIAQAEEAKKVIEDALLRPARDLTRESERRIQIDNLLLQGREAEAAAMQDIWRLGVDVAEEEKLRLQIQTLIGQGRKDEAAILQRLLATYPEIRANVRATAEAEQAHVEALRKAQEIQSAYLDATRSIRGEVEAILSGTGKLGNLKNVFKQLQGRILAEQLFGDVFRDLDRWVKEKTGIGSSVDMMAKETERAGAAAGTLADALAGAAARISGGGSASSPIYGAWNNIGIPDSLRAPSNDNYDPNAPIVVVAEKKGGGQKKVNDLTPEEYFRRMTQTLGSKFAKELEPLLGKKLAGNLGGVLGGVFEGQITTGTGFGAILGGLKEIKGLPKDISEGLGTAFKGAQTGSYVADIGNMLGLKMSKTGSQVGGAVGNLAFGPVGGIVGSIAGGFLAKLFGGTKSGYAIASNSNVSTGGNSTQSANAGNAASSLNDSLSSIARAFGSSLGDYAVSIGSRSSGYIRVSASGSSKVGDKNYNSGPDVLYDGKDMEEALRIALKNAIEDGAIQGISAGAKRLLSVSTNIDAQVEKALKFENVFKSLRAIKDPVGAAIEELDTEFKGLIDIFKEAGASASEYASLEELYGIRRADAVKEANQKIMGALLDFQKSLTVGNDTLSLRDRNSAALAVYNPLADRVKAGDTTAYDEFVSASQDLLAIQRELYGSTSAFFATQDSIKAITDKAVSTQTALADSSAATDSPFAQLAAQQSATTSAIDAQTSALIAALGGRLDSLNDNTIAVYRQLVANGATAADVSYFTQRLGF